MCVCGYVYVIAGTLRRKGTLDLLELELGSCKPLTMGIGN